MAHRHTMVAPQAMRLALRRRLRMLLPISHGRCGPTHGCGGQVDQFGDHALAGPRTGLLARRAKTLERVKILRVGEKPWEPKAEQVAGPGQQSEAKPRPTRNSGEKGRKDSSCSAARLADASMRTRTACSGTLFGCGRAECGAACCCSLRVDATMVEYAIHHRRSTGGREHSPRKAVAAATTCSPRNRPAPRPPP